MKHRPITAALAPAPIGAATHSQAIYEIRIELKQLRAHLETLNSVRSVALKSPAEVGAPDPRRAPKVACAASAWQSANPGGVLGPGTTTSLHLYGFGSSPPTFRWSILDWTQPTHRTIAKGDAARFRGARARSGFDGPARFHVCLAAAGGAGTL